MAAERAAELTEAYRILSDEGRRAEYDRSLSGGAPGAPAAAASAPAAGATPRPADGGFQAPPPPSPPSPADSSSSNAFSQERATRDSFIRRALLGRLRQAAAIMGGYDESQDPGF